MKKYKLMRRIRFFLSAIVFVIVLLTMLFLFCMILLLDRLELLGWAYENGAASVLIWAGLLSVLVSTALTFFASSIPLRPLRKYIAAMQKVAGGDFSVRLKVSGEGELARLLESFNKMVEALGNTELLHKDFMNNFSHEFKTPITSIRGYAMLLKDETLSPEEQKSYIDIIIAESNRLTHMAGNILYLNRIEKPGLTIEKQYFNIGEQIRQCVSLLYERIEKKEIELEIDLEDVAYCGNEEILNHVWINLLDNAIKFTPSGKKIRLHLVEENGNITFKIKDEGIGMPEEVRGQIFDAFYQSESSHAGEGYGLGLSIVKQAVSLHGGMVSVKSYPGESSEFTVWLPGKSRSSAES